MKIIFLRYIKLILFLIISTFVITYYNCNEIKLNSSTNEIVLKSSLIDTKNILNANNSIYFAVIYPLTKQVNSEIIQGNPFLGYFANGNFIKEKHSNINDFIKNYQINHVYNGYIESKSPFLIKLIKKSKPERDLYETLLNFEKKTTKLIDQPILISSKKPIQILKPTKYSINKKLSLLLKERTKKLFNFAQKQKWPEDQYETIVINKPIIKKINNSIFINFPLTLTYKEGNKDLRGSTFFLVKNNNIIFESFGHPEWTSGSFATIKTIKSFLFFKLKNYKNTIALIEYSGGWEHYGFALMDIDEGQILLESY